MDASRRLPWINQLSHSADASILSSINSDRFLAAAVRKTSNRLAIQNKRSHLLAEANREFSAGRLRKAILDERKNFHPPRILELPPRPQEMVACPYRDPASYPRSCARPD